MEWDQKFRSFSDKPIPENEFLQYNPDTAKIRKKEAAKKRKQIKKNRKKKRKKKKKAKSRIDYKRTVD